MTGAAEGRPRFELREPHRDLLTSYAEALARGWSPNNVRDVSQEQLAEIRADPDAFIRSVLSQDGTINLGNGRIVPKLPSVMRWIWDGAFCGVIGVRWQPGTDALPAHVLGHVGYAVVPWKRGNGFATAALGLMLPEARRVGLKRLEITTDKDNAISQKVILANGGRFIEEFVHPDFGPDIRLRYVIDLA